MQLEKKRTLLLLAPSHRQRRPSRGVGVFIRPLLPSPASRSRKDYKQRDTPPPPLPPRPASRNIATFFSRKVISTRRPEVPSPFRQAPNLESGFWLLLHPLLASRPCHRVSVVFPLGGWRAPEGRFRVLVLVRGGAILSTYRADSYHRGVSIQYVLRQRGAEVSTEHRFPAARLGVADDCEGEVVSQLNQAGDGASAVRLDAVETGDVV